MCQVGCRIFVFANREIFPIEKTWVKQRVLRGLQVIIACFDKPRRLVVRGFEVVRYVGFRLVQYVFCGGKFSE